MSRPEPFTISRVDPTIRPAPSTIPACRGSSSNSAARIAAITGSAADSVAAPVEPRRAAPARNAVIAITVEITANATTPLQPCALLGRLKPCP
ncbi:hypothetical protein FQZ97_826080 [compost metagenome]